MAQQINNHIVVVNQERHQHPELQLLNYLGKLKFCHSCAHNFDLIGAVWAYNLPENSIAMNNNTSVFFAGQDNNVLNFVNTKIQEPINQMDVENFLNGEYVQTPKLLETIRANFDDLRNGSYQALCASGFGPSEEQISIIDEILEKAKNGGRCAYFISGSPGSGKSYIAVLLLLKALTGLNGGENIAVLGYRNNRLINSIRTVFKNCERGLDNVIKFYSTGRNNGLAEGNPNSPHFRIAIYDEAQRMTVENIKIAMQRGEITVFFYDENQILNAEEGGWRDNFIQTADRLGISYVEKKLSGIHRVQGGTAYHEFVEKLLSGKRVKLPTLENYEFNVFDDITKLLDSLREKSQTHKVALVAAFTESPGDRNNMTGRTIENLRIGYPLYSGFEKYKNKNLQIYWLMDPQNQYPQFWLENESNKLTHCASIYGCQGFEADYIGVIWGRDFVWRNNGWQIGDNCEDSIGRPSLKNLINQANRGNLESIDLAKKLLINRYRIFLTRGILGTFVFCEDDDTLKYLRSIM